MKASTKKIVGGIAAGLALVVLVVGGFFATHEKTEVEVREPPTGEARQNPYLALVRLADRVCCTTYWMHSVDQPDYDSMVTLLADPDRELTPEQVDAWAMWVSDGGHLILPTTQGPANEAAAPLIARLGFSPAELTEADEADEADENDEADESEGARSDDTAKLPSWIPEDADAPQYRFSRPVVSTLDWTADDADWIARSNDGSGALFAASRRAGRGRITVVNDTDIFRNESIDKAEHATVIVDIFELPTETITPEDIEKNLPTVDVVLFSKRQSWMAYVFGHIWPFFAIMAGILALAFQGGRKRFGPMLADPPEERRSRLEHIDATGRFLWRHGSSATLVEAAQKALLRELEHSQPRLKNASPRVRNILVAELLDIHVDEARDMLRPPTGTQNPQTFTRRIRQIEEYRRTL